LSPGDTVIIDIGVFNEHYLLKCESLKFNVPLVSEHGLWVDKMYGSFLEIMG